MRAAAGNGSLVHHLGGSPVRNASGAYPETSSGSGATYRDVLTAASDASPWRQVEMVKEPADRSQLVSMHARWDDTMSANILDWLQLASQEPAFEELFATRLKHDPKDTLLLRFEQDHSEGEKHEAVCARQRALAEAEPAQANLQYLRIRCMSDDEQQNAQFISAHEKWPDNPWLNLAAGATYAERGDYPKAQPRYEHARKRLIAMRSYLSLDAARLRRLNAGGGNANTPTSCRAPISWRCSSRSRTEKIWKARHSNPTSRLHKAISMSPCARRTRSRTAASEYCAWRHHPTAPPARWSTKRWHSRSTTRTVSKIRSPCSPSPSGISAIRRPYLAHIGKMLGDRGKPVLVFLESVRGGANPEQARAALPQSDFSLRLHTLHAAVIMFGQRAPADWREESSRGLFVGERGYMRSL